MLRLVEDLPAGHTIVADRYFGGMDVAEGLAKKGLFFCLGCKGDRPAVIFKNFLDTFIDAPNDWISACRVLDNGGVVQATSMLLAEATGRNKYMHWLTNVYSDRTVVKNYQPMAEVGNKYNSSNHAVDRANDNIARAVLNHRFTHWEDAYFDWIFSVWLLNTWSLITNLTGIRDDFRSFLKTVQMALVPEPVHVLKSVYPQKGDCYACRSLIKKRNKTSIKCEGCKTFLCQNCFVFYHGTKRLKIN